MPDSHDLGDLNLADLVNYLLNGISYDQAAARDPGGISPTTLGNLANRARPVGRTPELKTLTGAARVLRTTPWALYHAAGISQEPLGLYGRPTDRVIHAAPMLPAGWWEMPPGVFGTWHAVGRALIESRDRSELARELQAVQEQCARLEAQVERLKPRAGKTRRTD